MKIFFDAVICHLKLSHESTLHIYRCGAGGKQCLVSDNTGAQSGWRQRDYSHKTFIPENSDCPQNKVCIHNVRRNFSE